MGGRKRLEHREPCARHGGLYSEDQTPCHRLLGRQLARGKLLGSQNRYHRNNRQRRQQLDNRKKLSQQDRPRADTECINSRHQMGETRATNARIIDNVCDGSGIIFWGFNSTIARNRITGLGIRLRHFHRIPMNANTIADQGQYLQWRARL